LPAPWRGSARGPGDHRRGAWRPPALWGRRLLPAAALSIVPQCPATRERHRQAGRRVLLPSMGSGSRPAARRRAVMAVTLPPLHESVADGIAVAPAVAGFPLGSH